MRNNHSQATASIRPRLLLIPTLALVALASPPLLQGYVLTGPKWGTTSVPYYVNPQSKHVSQNAAISAIQTAAAGWNDQTQANITLVYSGTTNGSSLTMNNKNEVFFRDGSNGGNVAEAYWWWNSSNRLVDADIVFYEGAYTFFAFSGCSRGVYIENVGIHEFGHVLGLGHTSVSGATMAPSMSGYCDYTQLTLEPDDIAGVEALYPPPSSTNTAPSVSISSPANNSSHADGAIIAFSGSANDTQDGSLTSGLRWTSNLAGPIGTGGSFARTLPVGTHVVTASVTDSGGLTGSKQTTLTVTVSAPPPSGPTLSASGYKVKGLQKVDLRWSGLTAATVDVYRSNANVATISNSGAATDPIDKRGGGSYSYKICAAGTTTCTNQVTVTF